MDIKNHFEHHGKKQDNEHFGHLIQIALADGKIDNAEMRLATTLAIKFGFPENEIPKLLSFLITGIRNKDDEDDLFEAYKKEKRRNSL